MPSANFVISVVNMRISAGEETWPLVKPFRISRGSRTEAQVVVVTITDGQHTGRGEGVPIKRYNQTPASVLAEIESIKDAANLNRQQLQKVLPPGVARNAVDCAVWDLEARISGKRAWELANIPIAPEVETTFTISLDTPEAMAAAAKAVTNLPILKLKLGGDQSDLARVEAVHEATPKARLLVDANESWTAEHYRRVVPSLAELGVELIEQPFPAEADRILTTLDRPIPVCADESCHTTADLPKLKNSYDVVNIKLDKTGGLTEALLLVDGAHQAGFKILIGCMVCTSLAIAPARLLASTADWVDLDGPLLLGRDRDNSIQYDNGKMGIPAQELWG